jgi:hypothetical protein
MARSTATPDTWARWVNAVIDLTVSNALNADAEVALLLTRIVAVRTAVNVPINLDFGAKMVRAVRLATGTMFGFEAPRTSD